MYDPGRHRSRSDARAECSSGRWACCTCDRWRGSELDCSRHTFNRQSYRCHSRRLGHAAVITTGFIVIAIASSISPAAAVGAFGLTVLTAVYVIGSAAVAGDLAEDIALNRRSETEPTEEPLARLKRRYVDEKIDNVEFERRVETLIEAGRTCERNITPDSKDPSQ